MVHIFFVIYSKMYVNNLKGKAQEESLIYMMTSE